MEYRQMRQKSRLYYYGEGKEFLTKEEAKEAMKRKIQKIKTELALRRIYEVTSVDLKEKDNAFQIILRVKIPVLLEM